MSEAESGRVRPGGAVDGRHLIRERWPDAELVIGPDTCWEAISEGARGRELDPGEWDGFLRKPGSEMLAPDGEP